MKETDIYISDKNYSIRTPKWGGVDIRLENGTLISMLGETAEKLGLELIKASTHSDGSDE